MKAGDWTLLFHPQIVGQLVKLARACERAKRRDPKGWGRNANAKLLAAIRKLMFEIVPEDPTRPEYRQGSTLGAGYRHWFRVKFGGRFRLFFRYDSRSKIIVYAWVNDESSLRKAGSKSDPYTVFQRMLERDNPPDGWTTLLESCEDMPTDIVAALRRDSNDEPDI